jgi:AraC-like DNA-binding protein
MSKASVAAGYASALIDFAQSKGADAGALYAASGLTPAALENFDARLPFNRYQALMRAAIALTGDPAFALEYGAGTDFRNFSVVGLIAHASTTMAEALAQMNRYARLVIEVDGVVEGPRFANVMRDGGMWLEDLRENPNEFPELTETTWSRFIVGSRRNFPEHVFALEAHVTHAAPAHRDAYERIWQVPVTFGAVRNAIRMNPIWPTLRIHTENRYAFGVLTDRAETLLNALRQSESVKSAVEKNLLAVLHTGDASIDRIAPLLGMSRQTLYRRLKSEGVTYQSVLDDLRRRMALDYLGARRVSVNETAYLVGFSDPAAFSRAFKRWTGRSPREARR